MSEDGLYAIVVIALLGNPFSTRYARARSRGRATSPHLYSAMNVALYGPRGGAFSLTERAVSEVGHDGVAIGPSRMSWDRGALHVSIDERTTPWGHPLRGTVRLSPEGASGRVRALDEERRHLWCPVAPLASIEVDLVAPHLRFRGHGYHDANAGAAPLEASFSRWNWARARLNSRESALSYDTTDWNGGTRPMAFVIDRDGDEEPLPLTAPQALPVTRWGIPRSVRAHEGARIVRDLEDTPFYSRSLLETKIRSRNVLAVHEELSCARLRQGWVRFLLGFRMGRG